MSQPQNVTYLPNVIKPRDRHEIDALCAAADLIVGRQLGDRGISYEDVEVFGAELSEIAHKLISVARRNIAMPEWWRA